MKSLAAESKLIVKKMIGIYRGKYSYIFNEVEVLPVETFLNELFSGNIF